MQAAIATSRVRPYMWIVSGPRSIVPVCGEGMEARLTAGDILPAWRNACARCLDQDVDRRLVRAPVLDQLDRQVQVDVVPRREGDGVAGVVARSNELLGAPVLDAIELGVLDDMYLRRSHAFGIRC